MFDDTIKSKRKPVGKASGESQWGKPVERGAYYMYIAATEEKYI